MITPNTNLLCRQAEPHYYCFLNSESHGFVPESIVNHIEQCQYCKERINQLEQALSQAECDVESEQGHVSSAVAHMLKLNFAYTGKAVTCETVRPFLPTLLEPSLEIRIPTPITAHLDKCRQCSENLETIRELNLSSKQLCRLSQLFADTRAEDTVSCSQAQAAILAVVTMALSETNADVLKHLCTCPDCRKLLYQHRETVYYELLQDKADQNKFPCEGVSASDIFDYVVPYGVDPANDEYAKFRKSFTAHAAGCPKCLAKVQELHHSVYSIIERAESGVATVYTIDGSGKVEAISESNELYAGFPIKVEVTGLQEAKTRQPTADADFTGALRRKVPSRYFKPLVKTAAAAAAVILIACALFFSTTTARGITLEQIYKAIERIKNVYISTFVPDQEEPIQEQWVSRTSSIYMRKTGDEFALWDIGNGLKKEKHTGAAAVETVRLSTERLAVVEREMGGSLGLVPFNDISEIPGGAQWSRVMDEESQNTAKGAEVYDLMWGQEASDGSVIFRKCRVFVDAKTNIPRRTELYRKLSGDDEYALRSVKVVKCLSDSEMQTILKKSPFSD